MGWTMLMIISSDNFTEDEKNSIFLDWMAHKGDIEMADALDIDVMAIIAGAQILKILKYAGICQKRD